MATRPLTRPPTHDHTEGSGPPGLVGRLAVWALAHRARVVALWVVLLVGAMAASSSVGPHYVNNLALSGTDSQRATDLLNHNFPTRAGDVDQIVFHSSSARWSQTGLSRPDLRRSCFGYRISRTSARL